MPSIVLLREHLDVICLQTSFFKQLIDYRGELGAHLSKVLPLPPFLSNFGHISPFRLRVMSPYLPLENDIREYSGREGRGNLLPASLSVCLYLAAYGLGT